MATVNPFADDDVKGDVWEQGYLAGFAEPHKEQFRPFSPDLLDVFRQGVQAGSQDRQAGPSDGGSWEDLEGVAKDVGEEVLLHALGVALEKVGIAAGGLISLVISVLSIPGDVQLKPLPVNSQGPADQDSDVTYLAVCPRTDHPMVTTGVTPEGYWTGAGQSSFTAAASDMKDHGHPETFVVRCSTKHGTCGPVWPLSPDTSSGRGE